MNLPDEILTLYGVKEENKKISENVNSSEFLAGEAIKRLRSKILKSEVYLPKYCEINFSRIKNFNLRKLANLLDKVNTYPYSVRFEMDEDKLKLMFDRFEFESREYFNFLEKFKNSVANRANAYLKNCPKYFLVEVDEVFYPILFDKFQEIPFRSEIIMYYTELTDLDGNLNIKFIRNGVGYERRN